MPSTVLIITNDDDVHADAVIEELNRRDVPVFRFNPEQFPHSYSISIEVRDGYIDGEIRTTDQRVALNDICAAWYRRSRNLFAATPELVVGKLDNYVKVQAMATMAALCEGLQTLWVGHPHKLRRADVKALQLAAASKAGLKTPATLTSNDPTQVAAFAEALGDTACAIKPLIAVAVNEEHEYRLPLTTTLPRGHALSSVSLAPTMFQPYIEKAFELRCVVMGEKIFCARINSQANELTRKDWRAGEPEHEVFSLPEHVKASIRRLMRSFDINFASIDMIVTPTGEYVFLDLNPNGQWLWLEIEVGLPLVAGMADLLTTHHSRPAQACDDGAVGESQRVAAYA
jgi:glutathione synthase/RimK-type ligase-like ATP-grasp enzyme